MADKNVNKLDMNKFTRVSGKLALDMRNEAEKQETNSLVLMSSINVADYFEKSRQWVDWALINLKDFPQPIVEVNRYKGWLRNEVVEFKEEYASLLNIKESKKKEQNTNA